LRELPLNPYPSFLPFFTAAVETWEIQTTEKTPPSPPQFPVSAAKENRKNNKASNNRRFNNHFSQGLDLLLLNIHFLSFNVSSSFFFLLLLLLFLLLFLLFFLAVVLLFFFLLFPLFLRGSGSVGRSSFSALFPSVLNRHHTLFLSDLYFFAITLPSNLLCFPSSCPSSFL